MKLCNFCMCKIVFGVWLIYVLINKSVFLKNLSKMKNTIKTFSIFNKIFSNNLYYYVLLSHTLLKSLFLLYIYYIFFFLKRKPRALGGLWLACAVSRVQYLSILGPTVSYSIKNFVQFLQKLSTGPTLWFILIILLNLFLFYLFYQKRSSWVE